MRRATLLSIVLAAPLVLLACASLERVRRFGRQAEQVRQWARVEGRIETVGEVSGVLVVVLARSGETEADPPIGVDTFVRVSAGSYAFPVAPGRFLVGAYEDRNRNGLLDPGERMRPVDESPVLEVGPGERVAHDLILGAGDVTPPDLTEAWDVLGLSERSPAQQAHFSLWAWSVQGAICSDLGDGAFGPDAADRGLWEIVDFVNEGRAGIHFLEPYDPDRVPVLFVHGIRGHPQQFAALMDALDRERFQPWFYFYPSGFPLDGLARHLSTLLQRLEAQHDFGDLAIVAHSMGGLVARGAILDYWEETGRDDVRLFVTFSTPWSGVEGAERAGRAPFELPPSFADMKPSSAYLRGLFYGDAGRSAARRLPEGAEFHMLLGFRMRGRGRIAGDGTVSVASQARLEAQAQAATIRALDRGHADILQAPEASERLNLLLAQRFD
jgi:pimeloyl-ACP methyl ester carboxylesterase